MDHCVGFITFYHHISSFKFGGFGKSPGLQLKFAGSLELWEVWMLVLGPNCNPLDELSDHMVNAWRPFNAYILDLSCCGLILQ